VTPWILASSCHRFGGTRCLHLQGTIPNDSSGVVICGCFNDSFASWETAASNNEAIRKRWTGKGVKASGHDLNSGKIAVFPCMVWGTPGRKVVEMIGPGLISEPWTFRIRRTIAAYWTATAYAFWIRWLFAGFCELLRVPFTPSQAFSILVLYPVHKIDANNIASWFLSDSLEVRAAKGESRSVVRCLCLSCAHSPKRGHSVTMVRQWNHCGTDGWWEWGGWS
jgi:hypothetical protein